jgi:cobalt-zinc-cadmium efflux system protein
MKEKIIIWVIIFNLIIIISEILFGLISNSFALIADALHNTGDVIAIVITLIALKLGSRKTTFKYTFGFLRAEMMAAYTNTMFLLVTMIYMIYESIVRFITPEVIDPRYMIVVGLIAVVANGLSAYILNILEVSLCSSSDHFHHHHHQHGDANIKSAYLHMLADALISVGVVVAGIFIYFFKIYYLDSLLTIVFSLYIIYHSYPLLKRSFLSLMDINIVDITMESLEEIILADDKIVEYHDLHIHKPSSKDNFISFHIVLADDDLCLSKCKEITNSIKERLEEQGFTHILIQVDTKKQLKNRQNCDMLA